MRIILILLFYSACIALYADDIYSISAENPIPESALQEKKSDGIGAASTLSEEDSLFYAGAKFYTKGDYMSAFALFREIPPESRHYLPSLYLSANIGSIEGGIPKSEVYGIFERIFKNPKSEKKTQIAAALQFSRFARVNDDFDILSATLKEFLREQTLESEEEKLLSWHLIDANCRLALKNADASGNLMKMALENLWILFKENEGNPDSLASDMVIYTALGDSDYIHAISPISMSVQEKDRMNAEKEYRKFVKNFLEKRIKNETPKDGDSICSLTRKALVLGEFSDEKFLEHQAELSLYAQINLKNPDINILEKKLRKTPFVDYWWRAAYLIAEHFFDLKNYGAAVMWAESSANVAPVEMNARWKIYMLLGDAFRLSGRPAESKDCYMRISESRKCKGEPSAEALYKIGLIAYDEKEWAVAYKYFERVFIAYFHFEYWGSRAYYWAAMCHKNLGNNDAARSVLVEYFRRAKDRKSKIYTEADQLSRFLLSDK